MTKFSPFAPFEWQLSHGRQLTLGPNGILMGILNSTPDSFSDGGKNYLPDAAVKSARRMIRAGAEIIDIGGESTRPGAYKVTAREEQSRVLPIIEALSASHDVLISIDTYRASTAELAIKAGAHIINDVCGFQKDEKIAPVAAEYDAGCVLMHTGRERSKLKDPVKDHFKFLHQSLKIAKKSGVMHNRIVLDPGFGFAKDPEENIELLARMEELFALGQPLLTGTSRKRFIGAITGRDVKNREQGTVATTIIARLQGSAIFRVHDVPKNRDALLIADAVIKARKQAVEKGKI